MDHLKFLVIGFLWLSAISCKHEPQNLVVASNDSTATDDCNADTVYFKNTIQPILNAACAYSGCHDAASHEEGIILDTYENIIRTGKVKAGKPEDSKIYEKITENDMDDIMPPPPNAPLSAAQINAIYTWIMQGAKNNECLGCDSINVTYNATIKPIVETICQSCHSGSNPSGGILLQSYDDVAAFASTGQLVGVVTHADGYPTMPDPNDSTKFISTCKIRQIIKWVNDGYPNN
jgi:hypothetical protein